MDRSSRLHLLVAGTGETVVWLHGYTLDSTIWSEVWSLLPGYRHVGVDLPGHGSSPVPREGETLAELGGRLAELMDELAASHLVGLSFGAMVALAVATARPAALSALVLASPALAGGPRDPDAQQCNLDLERMYRSRGRGPWLTARWMEPPSSIFLGVSQYPALRQKLSATIDRHSWRELGTGALGRLLEASQTPSELRTIRASTLVLVGEDDSLPFRRTGELLKRDVPRCERLRMPGAHLALLEHPGVGTRLIARHFEAVASDRVTTAIRSSTEA